MVTDYVLVLLTVIKEHIYTKIVRSVFKMQKFHYTLKHPVNESLQHVDGLGRSANILFYSPNRDKAKVSTCVKKIR